jgi:hypothetical protein
MLADPTAAVERSKVALMGDVVRRFGEATIRASGSSMVPSIWPGDVLTIRRRFVSEVRTGQIAVFARHGRLVAHRVVAHEGRHLVTQGDGVRSSDLPVREAELLGVVAFISRNGKNRMVPAAPGFAGYTVAAVVRRLSQLRRILQHVGRVRLTLSGKWGQT